MNKKPYFSIFIITILLVSLIIFSCAINEIRQIASNPNFNPKWDMGFDVAVYDKTITLEENFSDISIDATSDSFKVEPLGVNGGQWPDPGGDLYPIPCDLTVNLQDIDIDDDATNDIRVEGIYSTNARLIFTLWVEDNDEVIAIETESLKPGTVEIEGEIYTFGNPTVIDNKLVYVSNNFLNSSTNYNLYFGGDGDVDITQLEIETVEVGDLQDGNPDYQIYYTFSVDMGDFQPICEIVSTYFDLFNEEDLPLPLGELPLSGVEDFKFTYIIDSDLPLKLNILQNFSATPTPNPSIDNFVVSSGNLGSVDNPILNYYSLSSNNTTHELVFVDDVTTYSNMELNMKVRVKQAENSLTYRISPDNYIRTRMNISGTATVSF